MLPAAKYLFLWFSMVPWDGLITTFIPREFVTESTTFTWTSHHLLSPSFFFFLKCRSHQMACKGLQVALSAAWIPVWVFPGWLRTWHQACTLQAPHYQHSLDGCCPKISAACCPACSCPSSHCRERERPCLMPESALFSNSSLSPWYKGF